MFVFGVHIVCTLPQYTFTMYNVHYEIEKKKKTSAKIAKLYSDYSGKQINSDFAFGSSVDGSVGHFFCILLIIISYISFYLMTK